MSEKHSTFLPVAQPPLSQPAAQTVPRKSKLVSVFKVWLIASLGYWVYTSRFPSNDQKIATESNKSALGSIPLDTLTAEYLKVLETSNYAGNWSYEFTKAPHLAGTNPELVDWQKDKFEEFGLQNVYTEDFDVYINYPIETSLKLLNASSNELVYHPTLTEDKLEEDPTTNGDDLIPAFHGYSANGNATGEFIYANYGTREDFKLLADNNVDVTGKVVIVRYGKIFRGLKVRFAQEAGAIGALLYSEPSDDGYVSIENGFKPYPEGPARNPSSLQRGSVQFLSQAPGDPTTPGWPSKGSDVHRVDPHHSIPKIPSLPISYKEVQPILAQLNGHGLKFEKDWEGSLKDVSYNVGPNPGLKLNLLNNQEYNVTKLWNVYGEIEGVIPDEVILLGNHRDAWIKGGAGDPNSGSSVTLEIIRALNELKVKFGWKPLRTIKFASWDGEEYGLIGSTEYGELHHKELQKKVVAYLNLDVGASGSNLRLQGSPILYQLLNDNAKKILHPKDFKMTESGELEAKTLYEHFYEKQKSISILGSGSDFTVFLEHLGIPSLDLGFNAGGNDSIYHYHSNYDSYYWISTFGDPGFKLHNTAAKYLGLITLDLVQTKILKFGLVEDSNLISKFFNASVAGIPKSWLDQGIRSCQLHEGKGFVYDDNHKDLELKALEEIFIEINGENPLALQSEEILHAKTLREAIGIAQAALDDFINISEDLEDKIAVLNKELSNLDQSSPWNPFKLLKRRRVLKQVFVVNLKLKFLERFFLYYKGLHTRPWFRHIVYVSGRNTGYAGQTWPGLNEGIEDEDFKEVTKWVFIISNQIKKASRWITIH